MTSGDEPESAEGRENLEEKDERFGEDGDGALNPPGVADVTGGL